MNTLGKYYHDFPRLAKESGYNFQLFRGKINWTDLDQVNTQEIIDNRNFQLLEDNLIQIINCNLEKEFDLSGIDTNFIKLFKLAQLGVDYLSYCELYLDRCVILLQEQLSTLQEKFLILKEENEKKDEELKGNKQKMKLQSQNYKCSKCEKIFLNEAYLRSHEKRRHRNSNDSNEGKTFKNQTQQTEEEIKTVSASSQTEHDETNLSNCELDKTNDILNINTQELKINNLMRDLEELKARLSLAEKTMEEKKSEEKNFQNTFPSPVIPVIHSYISPHRNGYFQMSGATAVVQGFPGQFVLQEDAAESHETVKKGNKTNFKELHTSSDQYPLKEDTLDHQTSVDVGPDPEIAHEERERIDGVSKNAHVILKTHPPHTSPKRLDEPVSKPDCDVLTQDIHPKTNGTRKTKNNEVILECEDIVNDSESSVWGPSVIPSNDSKLESESTVDNFQMRTSTPSKLLASPKSKIRETSLKNKWSNAFSPAGGHAMKRKSKSEETLVQDISANDNQEKSKSLLRKIVTKKSPKIQGLKTNLKNSFSQLYESVSSTAKKTSDVEQGKSKTDIVEGLHNRLKELGVDPEWSGIPKETMKQKLRILEHHRNLLSKENRLYPFLRRKLEKHVLKRIQGSSLLSKKLTGETNDGRVNQNDQEEDGGNINTSPSEITVYDSDGDSESDVLEMSRDKRSNSPGPPETGNRNTGAGPSKVSNDRKDEERETTDFSIFQAGKFKEGKAKVIELEVPDDILQRQKNPSAQDELLTDSDSDDELFKHFEEHSMETIAKHLSGKTETSKKDIIASFPERADDDEFLGSSNVKSENQSILKSETETTKLTAKKKVLFADVPEVFEAATKPATKAFVDKQKITNPLLDDDDDDWSIESEWTINNEL